jgi:hypothetical protein
MDKEILERLPRWISLLKEWYEEEERKSGQDEYTTDS